MSWDDGKHTKVKSVQLTFDDVIRSIQVEYHGTTLQSQPRGNTVGDKSDGFTLSPDEYITELSGYSKTTFAGDVITLLTFKTNKKTYGPYGNKTQSFFSAFAPSGNQIAGFSGTSGNALNSIDVHFAPIPPAGSIGEEPVGPGKKPGDGGSKPVGPGKEPGDGDSKPVGPGKEPGDGDGDSKPGDSTTTPGDSTDSSDGVQKLEAQGGKGGNQWDDGAEHDGVVKIYVAAGGLGVENIKFDYVKNGKTKEGTFHGVKARAPSSTFEISQRDEHLISVEGWFDSSNIIQGIQFKTNKKESEIFGYEFAGDGTQFSLQVKDKKIVGFHGFADSHVNSLGAYFAPITAIPLKPAKKLQAVGGEEGTIWDDGIFDGVKKILVGQGNDGVSFITIEYNKGSQTIIGDGHGKKTLLDPEPFELEDPSEYITGVGVYYESLQGEKAGTTLVTSLIFKTNKRESQPYGMTSGKYVELKEDGHKIVGFHGKAGDYVHQIGVYVAPITN